MPLPNGEDFDDEGKKSNFFNFEIFFCFWYICAYNISVVNADFGPERPVGMSPIARHVPCPIDVVSPY